MKTYTTLTIEIENALALVTIQRPESLNALNAPLIKELGEAMDTLEEDRSVRVIILTGSGNKAFVAGADIKEFADYNAAQAEKMAKEGQENLFNKIENLSKPVIAAVNGFALGGGLELAMACHIRYASENAKLGLPEVTLGLIPGYGGTQRLPALIGKGRAAEMIFSAKMIDAATAEKYGLVNAVFPQESLIEETKKNAATIAKNSPLAIEKAIECIQKSGTGEGYSTEISSFGALFDLADKAEGVQAFLEKRKPNF